MSTPVAHFTLAGAEAGRHFFRKMKKAALRGGLGRATEI
jgi:hypothetical protein